MAKLSGLRHFQNARQKRVGQEARKHEFSWRAAVQNGSVHCPKRAVGPVGHRIAKDVAEGIPQYEDFKQLVVKGLQL